MILKGQITLKTEFLNDELWWGGTIVHAHKMPISADDRYRVDLWNEGHTQTVPLFLSSKGRYIWSEKPFTIEFNHGEISASGGEIILEQAGASLRSAYLDAMHRHFPFSGKSMPKEFFKTAQYNTWIEFTYDPTQEGILEYAENIIKNGYEPGILIIDEGWQQRYGTWDFRRDRFPDPKDMVKKLHDMGFIVMVWIVPFISADSAEFREVSQEIVAEGNAVRDKKEHLLRVDDGDVALINWWNGFSALLNMKLPADAEFLDNQLQYLMDEYGVDGFKFDGGSIQSAFNPRYRVNGGSIYGGYTADELNEAWVDFGAKYKYHEFKDTWKAGGKPIIERLFDKKHSWDEEGMAAIIPHTLFAGLIGCPFICPDMIGGGSFALFSRPDFKCDEELFVRMAQCSALLPMMQYSLSPWRVLSEENQIFAREAAYLHKMMAPEILKLVEESKKTGEPVIRSLEYTFPHMGYGKINDQFMLGNDILVAPVVTKGTRKRNVVIPSGKWQAQSGLTVEGPCEIEVDAPLDTLPRFKRIG